MNDDHSYAVKNTFLHERNCHKELYLEDIQTDEDKLNSSLLSSESTFMPVASGLSPVSPTSDPKLCGISLDLEDNDSTVIEYAKDANRGETVNKQEETSWLTKEDSNKVTESVETQEQIKDRVQLSSLDLVKANQADASNSSVSSEDQVLHSQPGNSVGAELKVTTLCTEQVTRENSDSLASVGQGADELQRMTKAATKLQACWKGFYARNYHPQVKEVRYEIRLSRMQEHIICLTDEIQK